MGVVTFLSDMIAAQRALARIPKKGYLHAAGYAVGSPKSRSQKRATQRLKRRISKKLAKAHIHNPAGSKLARMADERRLGVCNGAR